MYNAQGSERISTQRTHPINAIIPRTHLFADLERSQVKLSPDGRMLSYLAPYQGNLNIWVAPIDALEKAMPITDSEHPIRDYWWHPLGEWLIYSHDFFGDENWQLYGYHLPTKAQQNYTGRGCQARLLQMSKERPTTILIALNERDKHYHDVYILDIESGEKQCILENNDYWEFIGDSHFHCRIGVKINAHSGEYIDLDTQQSLMEIPQHDLFGL